MTDIEIISLRIRCVEVFVQVASRHALEKDEVFQLGEKLWEFAKKTTESDQKGQSKKTPSVKKQPSVNS